MRAELRAAAHSSNLRALEFSGSGGQHALGMHDLIVGIGGGVPTGLKGPNGNGKSSTCQAAIETLLWFGLALGDAKDGTKPSEAQQQACRPPARLAAADAAQTPRAPPRATTRHHPPPAAAHRAIPPPPQELAQLEADATQDLSAWDWEAAACQVGFDDTSGGADGAGAVGDAAAAAAAAAACALPMSSPPTAARLGEQASPKAAEGHSDARSEHSEESEHSTATTVDAAAAAAAAAVAAGGAAATPGHVALAVSGVEHGVARQHSVDSVLSVVTEDAHSPTRPGVAAAYRSDSQSREVSPGAPSPAEGEGRALGRGGRVRKPVRQWESSAPLLKWEKEAMGQKVREKRPRAEPRAAPAGGAPYLYEATYQSDGDYYGDYYGSSGNPLGLGGVDMSALSELEPLGSSADDAAKRRRTWMTGF